MNDFMYNPMAVRQQAVDPMAVRQQQVQPTLTPMAPSGMPAQPLAAQIPNPAVYGNQQVINTGVAMYGSPEMRQQSVMMVGDLDNNGVMSDYETTRDNAIKEAIAKQK